MLSLKEDALLMSDLDIKKFKSGEDNDDFERTIAEMDSSFELNESRAPTLSDLHIEQFKSGEGDDEFTRTIEKMDKQWYDVSTVRKRCRVQAQRFKFDVTLFDRMPMWVFRVLAAEDPMCRISGELTKIDTITIFMLINGINPDLMMAMYLEGRQSIDDAMKLHKFFKTMKKLYDKTDKGDLISLFGNCFTYHCQSRTLRQIDLSVVQHGTRSGHNEPFIPDTIMWRRERLVRSLIRKGEFSVLDEMALDEVKRSWKNGQRLRGMKKQKL